MQLPSIYKTRYYCTYEYGTVTKIQKTEENKLLLSKRKERKKRKKNEIFLFKLNKVLSERRHPHAICRI